MVNPDWSDWVPTYFCDNPIHSSLEEVVTGISVLAFVLDDMDVLEFSTHNFLIADLSEVPG